MATPLQSPFSQFFDANGDPLSGGKLYAYEAGTTTPKDTYTDAGGLTPASNPVILDAYGRAAIWITGTYRFDLFTSTDVLVRSIDNVPAFTAGGDMTKAVYDPANIAQQVVGTTAVQTLTNKTLVAPVIGATGDAITIFEEDTFTPTVVGTSVAGAGTYSTQEGKYTRLGNRIFFNIRINMSAHTGSGNMTIAGLPVAAAIVTGVEGSFENVTSPAGTIVKGLTQSSSTAIALYSVTPATGAQAALAMDVACNIYISGHYTV